jgi:hypothetical protein
MVPRARRSVWQNCARAAAAMRKRSLQPTRVTPGPRPRQKQQTGARGFPKTAKKSSADRTKVARVKDPQRSRITNGSALLPGVDGRSAWVRRAKDLFALHISDLGGEDNVSEAERALLRRAVTLIIELERREVMFAQAGAADNDALAIYQTTVNTLRRTLEPLGLQRRPRDVGPTLGQILRDGQRDL